MRHLRDVAVAAQRQLGQGRNQLRRQVVDAEVAEVLERADRLRLARPRQPGQDDERRPRRRPAPRRRAARSGRSRSRSSSIRRRLRRAAAPSRVARGARQRPGGVVPARPQQLVARRHLDQDREAAAGRHRHAHERHLHARAARSTRRRGPADRTRARRPSARAAPPARRASTARRAATPNSRLDVDQAEAAHLHVVARQLRTGADQDVSARRRTSTGRRRPGGGRGTTRSSAHSLLPMPLSPMMSTPRPRMSISTPWTVTGSASVSSRQRGRPARSRCRSVPAVSSSGTPRRSAAMQQLRRRAMAAGDEDAREVVRQDARREGPPASASTALEVAHLALAEDEDAARCRYSSKPASASPVFWMCGLWMARSRPAAPASSSSGEADALGRRRSRTPTRNGDAMSPSPAVRPASALRLDRGRGGRRRSGSSTLMARRSRVAEHEEGVAAAARARSAALSTDIGLTASAARMRTTFGVAAARVRAAAVPAARRRSVRAVDRRAACGRPLALQLRRLAARSSSTASPSGGAPGRRGRAPCRNLRRRGRAA